jgi:hypothetical protein
MNPVYIFLMMLFMHILDDFHFQGCLANLKQKSWWATNAPDPKYKNDWVPALLAHCLSWSMMVMAPCVIFMDVPVVLVVTLVLFNCAVHFFVDDLKCNRLAIGLVEDQLLHLSQIIFTFIAVWKIPEMIA